MACGVWILQGQSTVTEPSVKRRSLPLALPARQARTLAESAREIDQYWRPSYAVWELTLQCDLACHHCGSRAGRARPDELSTTEALDLCDQLIALGVNEVSLIGGEAYLREDWLQIVARLASNGIRVSIATGARGLTREMIVAAKSAGLKGISVSVDGFETEHDTQRGVRGSYASAMRAMRAIREVGGIKLTANTQVNRHSLPILKPLFLHLVAQGATGWQVQLTAAMGRAADEPRLFIEPWQVLDVHPVLALCKREAEKRKVLFWPGNNIGYFGPFEPVLRGHFKGGYRGTCGAGRASLGIEANGDIKGCPSLPTDSYVGGNVREHTLKAIWERSDGLRFTRNFTANQLSGYCASCYYADDCRGGCHWTAHVLLGYPGDNPYCHHRAMELMKNDLREVVKLRSLAPGLPFDHAIYSVEREAFPTDERERIEKLTSETEELLYAH